MLRRAHSPPFQAGEWGRNHHWTHLRLLLSHSTEGRGKRVQGQPARLAGSSPKLPRDWGLSEKGIHLGLCAQQIL